MKKFINDPDDIVDEMLEGFLVVHSQYVRKLDRARTVVRADAPVDGKVGVITGGGSGHKPAFIGFVGEGMLDAVAVGEIFTSPPPNAVFEAAKAVDGGEGVLFLLGNYARKLCRRRHELRPSCRNGRSRRDPGGASYCHG